MSALHTSQTFNDIITKKSYMACPPAKAVFDFVEVLSDAALCQYLSSLSEANYKSVSFAAVGRVEHRRSLCHAGG